MPPAPVDSREIRQYLDKVLASASFASAPRVRQFLRFVVEETLEGHAGEIKESVVAVHVFGRTGDFDSHSDSVVRVQATHLRKRLREYYRVEGAETSPGRARRTRGSPPVMRTFVTPSETAMRTKRSISS